MKRWGTGTYENNEAREYLKFLSDKVFNDFVTGALTRIDMFSKSNWDKKKESRIVVDLDLLIWILRKLPIEVWNNRKIDRIKDRILKQFDPEKEEWKEACDRKARRDLIRKKFKELIRTSNDLLACPVTEKNKKKRTRKTRMMLWSIR